MKRHVPFFFLLLFFIMSTCGCTLIHIEEEPAMAVEYGIMKEAEVPKELLELIDERKKEEFEFTYLVGEDLYLVKGYGQQMTGGYSIQVREVSASSTTVFLKTSFLGPRQKPQHSEPSYPFIVVKIHNLNLPVQFETVLCEVEDNQTK